jgi:signal transduction histidine kinase
MNQSTAPNRGNNLLMSLAGWLTVLAVTLITWITIDDPGARWLGTGLCLAFGLMDFVPFFWQSERHGMLYLLIETLIAAGLFLTGPNAFAAPVLFFVLSSKAMMIVPARQGLMWIAAFSVMVFIFLATTLGALEGFVTLLPYLGGYIFFGAFGKNAQDAETARNEAQRLLSELQVAHAQLRETSAQVERLAVADERNRLSRELHDALGHRLTVAVVQLEGAQRLAPSDPDRAGRMIGTVREQMKEALADLRRTLQALRNPSEDDLPLGPALSKLTRQFQEATGLSVQLHVSPDLPPLPDPQRHTLYRGAQEALTNAQRHAGASHVWVEVAPCADGVRLSVDDDGQGLPDDLASGLGLRGLRERTDAVGGALTLGASPRGGAQIVVSVPGERGS